MTNKNGKLFLIPTPLAEGSLDVFPPETINAIRSLKYFISERSKTNRRFIKSLNHPLEQSELNVQEIPKHGRSDMQELLKSCLDGHDTGLMSEAGAPCIADPGGEIVRQAHKWNIPVIPLTGPSAIFLALMASGMNGQNFSFKGYLPAKKDELPSALRSLEKTSQRDHSTQIFIETPYRNTQLIDTVVKTLNPRTLFGIAANIHSDNPYFKTLTIADWKKVKIPDFHKIPVVFCLMSE